MAAQRHETVMSGSFTDHNTRSYQLLTREGVSSRITAYLQWLRTPSRAAAVCLGLLCVLLLAGIIDLGIRLQASVSAVSYNSVAKDRENIQIQMEDLRLQLSDLSRRCEEGWVKFQSSCYFVSGLAWTWEDSRQYCLDRGADLVIVNSRDEQVFIHSFRRTVWIGMTDEVEEGTYHWVDGTPVTMQYWSPGQPTGHHVEHQDCVEYWYLTPDQLNTWNDKECSVERYWMCEK